MTDLQDYMTVRGLCATRAGTALTQPVSFTLRAGDYVQLRGPNGCGKSTLLRHLAGLVPAANGIIEINASPCVPSQIPQSLKIAYLGHQDGLQDDLTGYENYELLTGRGRDELVQKPLYERHVIHYSAGQRQLLSLLMLDDEQDIWLLDEPSASLDAHNHRFLEERIAGFLALGGAVIASTHSPLGQSLVSQLITLEAAS